MTTETLSLPPPAAGVCHRSQENSEVDIFRDMVESRDMAENVPITTTPEDSLVPPLDSANCSLAKGQALEELPSSVQKEDRVEKATPSLSMPSEEIKIADDVNQSSQGQDNGHSVHQEKALELSPEQLKAEDSSDLLAEGEGGRHLECHNEIPDAFSEPQSPAGDSMLEGKEEEEKEQEKDRQHLCHSEDPTVPTDSLRQLEVSQEANESPLIHQHGTSEFPSEPQKSISPSSHLDMNEESGTVVDSHGESPEMGPGSPETLELANSPTEAVGNLDVNEESGIIVDSHAQTPEMCPGSPDKLELASSPTQAVGNLDMNEESGSIVDSHGQPPEMCPGSPEKLELASKPTQASGSQENSQANCESVVSPESPSKLLLDTDSPKEPGEEDSLVFPSNHTPSPASSTESQESGPAGSLHEDTKSDCQEISGKGKEERTPSGQVTQPLDYEESASNLNGLSSQAGSGHNLLANEEQVAQSSACTSAAPSAALADPLPDADLYCQQRAAGAGLSDPAPQAVPTQSPVATGIFGPAHQGLAAACDREALPICEPSGARNNSKPQSEVGAEAVVESEKGKEATEDTESEETTREPEREKDLSEAENLARDFPVLKSPPAVTDPAGPKDPAGAMVLASAEDPLEARDRADSQDLARIACPVAISEHAGPTLTLPERLLLDARDPAKSKALGSAAEPAFTTPISDEPSMMGSLGWTGNAADHPETPIEREIRLHLEREELLRRERGLASVRGTQEYVEVRIRPFLNQSGMPCVLPKEKERQWAGAQMQREIQRECRREEDLVQLGKVRGAYDRGTPQELQEKKMIFEQPTSLESLAPKKGPCSSAEGTRGPSFAEASRATNMVILDSEALLQPQRPSPERASPSGNPFFCLRAKSPQSLLEQEVQEAQERERELQRQRYSLYGSISPCQPAETSEQEDKEVPTQPERPSCKKLEVTWPPPTSSEASQVNGLHQPERSPRILRRQRSALIERWESGAVGNQEDQD